MRVELKLFLFFVALLVVAIPVLVFFENVRGASRLEDAIALAKSEGVPADVPAPVGNSVPDDENFFHGPLIGSLSDFHFSGSAFDGDLELVYTRPGEANRLGEMTLPKEAFIEYNGPPTGLAGYERGELPDFERWAGIFRVLPDYTVADPTAPPARQCLDALEARFGESFTLLSEAAQRRYSEAPVFWSDGQRSLIGRFSPVDWEVRDFSKVVLFRYTAAIHAGEMEIAFESLDIYMALLSGFAARSDLEAVFLMWIGSSMLPEATWGGIVGRRLDELALRQLQGKLSSFDYAGAVAAGFAGGIRATPPVFSLIRNDRKLGIWMYDEYGARHSLRSHKLLFRWVPRGWIDLNAATVIETMLYEGVIPWRDLDFSRFATAETRLPSPSSIEAILLFPRIGPRSDYSLRLAEVYVAYQQTIVACAVERFRLAQGRLPDTLEKLVPAFLEEVPVDPFDGKPMRYFPDEDQFVIYSIGSNGVDDGGYVSRSDRHRRNRDAGDWAWNFESFSREQDAIRREEAMLRIKLEEEAGRVLTKDEFTRAWGDHLRGEKVEEKAGSPDEERRRAVIMERARERIRLDQSRGE